MSCSSSSPRCCTALPLFTRAIFAGGSAGIASPLMLHFWPTSPHSPSPAEQQPPAAALHGSLPPLLFQKINRQQQTPTLREATDPDRASATAADAARRRRDLPCQICTEEEILISTSRFVFFSFFSAPSNSSLLGVAVAVTLPSYSLSLSPPPDAWLYTNTRAERIRLLSPSAAHQRQ